MASFRHLGATASRAWVADICTLALQGNLTTLQELLQWCVDLFVDHQGRVPTVRSTGCFCIVNQVDKS